MLRPATPAPCVHCGRGGGIKPANHQCDICHWHVHKKCEKTHNEQFKHNEHD